MRKVVYCRSLVGIFYTEKNNGELYCDFAGAGDMQEFQYEKQLEGTNISRAELISSRMTRYPGENGIPRMLGKMFGKSNSLFFFFFFLYLHMDLGLLVCVTTRHFL